MKRWATVLVLIAVAALLSVLPATALAGSARGASNTKTFADSIGEDPNAPDITSTVISNDDAGNITFQVNISNRPALTPDMFIELLLDTDQNASTGSADLLGADYVIDLESGAVDSFKWSGSDFTAAPSQSSLTFAYAATGPTIKISAADLGGTKAFNFAVVALSGITTDANGKPDFSNIHRDVQPDPGHGTLPYEVLTTLRLSLVAFTTAPKPAKAGKAFSVGLAANENDTDGPVEKGRVTCAATIAGKRLPAKPSALVNGIATCAWQLPKLAKGKTIRGTVTLVVQGAQVARSFSAKIT
jgi:hypothetical protein